jgi:hypothetical protein
MRWRVRGVPCGGGGVVIVTNESAHVRLSLVRAPEE